MAITGICELMAVATVRRLLLELGYKMLPEPTGTLVGPLARWIHQPRPEWGLAHAAASIEPSRRETPIAYLPRRAREQFAGERASVNHGAAIGKALDAHTQHDRP